MPEILYVDEPISGMRAVLERALTPEEPSWLGFERNENAPAPFSTGDRGELVALGTAVVWTAREGASNLPKAWSGS